MGQTSCYIHLTSTQLRLHIYSCRAFWRKLHLVVWLCERDRILEMLVEGFSSNVLYSFFFFFPLMFDVISSCLPFFCFAVYNDLGAEKNCMWFPDHLALWQKKAWKWSAYRLADEISQKLFAQVFHMYY